jgi:hypothetical protein
VTTKRATTPLTFEQYTRIYNVIQSLSMHFTENVGRECVLFSVVGAALMHAHYKKNAKVICGLGAVVVHKAEVPTAVSWFAENESGHCVATLDAFHTWIECDEWVIDFMAPNYQEALRSSPLAAQQFVPRIPRLMLQKPIEQVVGSMGNLTRVGRTVFVGDQDVTTTIIDRAFDRPQLGDVVNIALTWHCPLPGSMPRSITITDDLGEITTINMVERQLAGAW